MGKRRQRTIEWIRDEFDQRVESWRPRKGTCYHCEKHAYRLADVEIEGEIRNVPVCNREFWRARRSGTLKHGKRALRDADVAWGMRQIKKARAAGKEIPCMEVWRLLNARLLADGREPVHYNTVVRQVCYHCDGFEGY